MLNQQERYESLLKKNLKYFHHQDFEKKNSFQKIFTTIPNQENIEKERNKIVSLRKSNKQPDMRPFYEEPTLNKEQEQHLFKQLNYLKFKAKKIISSINEKNINEKKLVEAEGLLKNIVNLRNRIANSNFRLATYILRTDMKRNPNKIALDLYLSDAYMDIVKSVDYFNFTLGVKFSTYCIWVLRKNFYRTIKGKKNKIDTISFDNDTQSNISEPENFLSSEVHQRENASYINKIIEVAKEKLNTRDIDRQILIVEYYFGINGRERKTLDEISKILQITKERVRQLKEKFLTSMRQIVINQKDCEDVL